MLDHVHNTLGVDEVGRGCLFGDVVAAAVMLPNELPHDDKWQQIKDSKKLTEKKRKTLRDFILQHAICYGIGECSPQEIDKINILQASHTAMMKAIKQAHNMLQEKSHPQNIDNVLIDGDRFSQVIILPDDTYISHECVINGDNRHLCIAAASIIAKCYRDEKIVQSCKENPSWSLYGFEKNKGYGTKQHFDAIKKYGTLQDHRLSFIHI